MATKIKKTAASKEGAPLQSVLRRSHICFERIIPDELDSEQHVRRALRGEMMTAISSGKALSANDVAHVARMAVVTSKKWGSGFTLRCRF